MTLNKNLPLHLETTAARIIQNMINKIKKERRRSMNATNTRPSKQEPEARSPGRPEICEILV
jgi:hypothetical protein